MSRQNKEAEIRVRVSPDDKDKYTKLAESKNKTLSEFIRYLLERECDRQSER